jgi:hypothetical protein
MRSPTLRNITRREYVRADLLEAYQNPLPQKGIPRVRTAREFMHVRLGDLAFTWMYWAGQPVATLNLIDQYGVRELHRGTWAGHRLDVVDWTTFQAEAETEDWKDVGHELVQDVARVYDRAFRHSR